MNMGIRAWFNHIATMIDDADVGRGSDSLAEEAGRALGARRVWAGWAWVLAILATAHLIAASLYVAGRATFQGIPPSILDDLSTNTGWIVAHVAAAAGLVAAMAQGPAVRSWACNISSAFLASWSLLLLMVGLSVERGVSLLGPAFGLLLAVAAQIAAQKFFAENVIKEAASQARSQPDEED